MQPTTWHSVALWCLPNWVQFSFKLLRIHLLSFPSFIVDSFSYVSFYFLAYQPTRQALDWVSEVDN